MSSKTLAQLMTALTPAASWTNSPKSKAPQYYPLSHFNSQSTHPYTQKKQAIRFLKITNPSKLQNQLALSPSYASLAKSQQPQSERIGFPRPFARDELRLMGKYYRNRDNLNDDYTPIVRSATKDEGATLVGNLETKSQGLKKHRSQRKQVSKFEESKSELKLRDPKQIRQTFSVEKQAIINKRYGDNRSSTRMQFRNMKLTPTTQFSCQVINPHVDQEEQQFIREQKMQLWSLDLNQVKTPPRKGGQMSSSQSPTPASSKQTSRAKSRRSPVKTDVRAGGQNQGFQVGRDGRISPRGGSRRQASFSRQNTMSEKGSLWGLPRMGTYTSNENQNVQAPQHGVSSDEPTIHAAKKIQNLAKSHTANPTHPHVTKRAIPEASDEEESRKGDSILISSQNAKLKKSLPKLEIQNVDSKGIRRKQTLREIIARSPTSEHLRALRLQQQASTSPRYTEKVSQTRGNDGIEATRITMQHSSDTQTNKMIDPEIESNKQTLNKVVLGDLTAKHSKASPNSKRSSDKEGPSQEKSESDSVDMSDFRPQESGDTNPVSSQEIQDIQIEDVTSDSNMENDRQRNNELRALKNKEQDFVNAESPGYLAAQSRYKRLGFMDSALQESYVEYQLDDKIGDDYIAKPQLMLDDSVGDLDSNVQSSAKPAQQEEDEDEQRNFSLYEMLGSTKGRLEKMKKNVKESILSEVSQPMDIASELESVTSEQQQQPSQPQTFTEEECNKENDHGTQGEQSFSSSREENKHAQQEANKNISGNTMTLEDIVNHYLIQFKCSQKSTNRICKSWKQSRSRKK